MMPCKLAFGIEKSEIPAKYSEACVFLHLCECDEYDVIYEYELVVNNCHHDIVQLVIEKRSFNFRYDLL